MESLITFERIEYPKFRVVKMRNIRSFQSNGIVVEVGEEIDRDVLKKIVGELAEGGINFELID